ncbi:hypothetical protein BOTBODRAFT_59697 [Botryobasidium botryosum FD-172 SS1]|uniref:Choline/carnitine acyltransferase domain-containing protein n=1 Tax=Botryobasidium botryosum (strain FD-172 SS1) TaxID=930990 RepID=A0A067LZP7_BOTB1|nr:hypothetical protein BOTBODRAFT_59697 [Botryobasidium botryosum FD-172 SS1]
MPSLEDTCKRYLLALKGLQDHSEHARTKKAIQGFLNGDGQRIQEKLKQANRGELCSCNQLEYCCV